MKEIEEQAIERRKKLYGCDGRCYCDGIWDEDLKCFTGGGVCGGIWKGYQQCMQPVRRIRKEAGGAILLPYVRV